MSNFNSSAIGGGSTLGSGSAGIGTASPLTATRIKQEFAHSLDISREKGVEIFFAFLVPFHHSIIPTQARLWLPKLGVDKSF